MAKIILIDGAYFFDAEDGTELVELPVWLEKSKATDKHPDGKPWIKLPKGNPTNRQYFSEDLFIATQVNGEVTVEVKTTPARVLGTTGIKPEIIKYLSEEDAAEYTGLVEGAIAEYKDAKAAAKKKKPEDMTVEELEAYINALRSGQKPSTASNAPKSFLDMFNDADYARYNELLAIAMENKANRPKATRRPLTEEEKAERAIKRQKTEISKAEALLEALRTSIHG